MVHIQHRCEGLANTLSRLATGATSRRKTLQAGISRAGQRDPDGKLAVQLEQARHMEARASGLARDVRTLVQWLRHDVLALAGPGPGDAARAVRLRRYGADGPRARGPA